MTSGAETTQETTVSNSFADVLYAVNEQANEDAGESYIFKVWQRLCWSGQCRLCRRYPEGKPVVPGTTNVTSIYNAARSCSGKVEFITPTLSVLEAVFRILIVNGNQPMRFSAVVDKLKEHWGTEFPQRVESLELLQRVLDSANEYHIGRAPETE